MNTARSIARSLVLVALLMMSAFGPISPAQAEGPSDLFFLEYIEGTSNNKALEIYNGTGAAINLATGGYNIQMYFNGNASAGLIINLTGTVVDGDVYVVAHSSANATILPQADQTNGAGWFNGDDAVVLRKGTTIIDVIGQIGFDPGSEWGSGLTSTADNTLRRKSTVLAGDPNGSDVFDPSTEWEGFATDTFDGLGSHTISAGDVAPFVSATTPANGATDIAVNVNIDVIFSEPVNVTGAWFTLSCDTSGVHSATISGGPTAFTLGPDMDFTVGEVCTLTILAAQVSDQDANDPPDHPAADFTARFTTAGPVCNLAYTHAYEIQGSGPAAAITGPVTTQGVVVGDYEGASPALRGFFIQDLAGDGNPATSDGIFIFEGSNANTVNLGDVVRVTGTAADYQDQTQITASSVVLCGTMANVAPVDVTLPFPSADYAEQYEGMLVRLPQTLYVTEHFQLGRFGQVVMSSGGRLTQPTNIVAPGAPALALQDANNLNRIIIDDASQAQNPDPILFGRGGNPLSAGNTLRGGDTATGIVGIMTYTWAGNSASGNAYRVRPVNALNGSFSFAPTDPRPAAAPAVGGTLKVASMNLLNFFNTFDGLPDTVDNCTNGVGGAATDCRGADTQSEFDRQWPKTVAAILAMNPDALGVNEIENDGYGPDSAIAFLVSQLNAATAPGAYAFIDVDAATGQVNALGTDAIKVGLIYQPAKVTPVGQTAALNTVAFVNGGDSAPRSRPSLAQAFEQNSNGARFVVDLNHLKSKGSACDAADAGDGQGNCNIVRVNAATELMAWLAGDPTGTGETDILLLGDYNSYAMEDPITVIRNAGYTNVIASFLGPDAYTYVFDGQWGYLDNALGSASLVPQITGVGEYHINSDEPSVLDYNTDFKTANLQNVLYAPDQFRVSDHDPVVVGLKLNAPPTVSAGGPYDVGEGGTVTVSAAGSDPDGDSLVYAWDLDNNVSFETPGQDVAFSAVSLDGPSSHPIKVQVTDSGGLAAVAVAIVNVQNVAPTAAVLFPASVNEGSTFSLSLIDPQDPSAADTLAGFTYAFDCGAGAGYVSVSGNVATCATAPGFSGLITVKGKIGDKDGGFTEYTAEVTVQSSYQVKRAVRDALATLPPSGDKKVDQGIQKAVADLDKSLAPNLWDGGSRLSQKGAQVFEAEKQAVSELMKIANPVPTVSAAIAALAEVDRVLALTAIDDALAANGDPHDIAKAQEEMGKAQDQQAGGAYDKAIEHYKEAWHHAQVAMKKAV